jgi:N utilization substance protein B
VGARRKGRELALQMLYQWDVSRAPVEEVVESSPEIGKAGDAAREFARGLVEGSVDRVEDIDKVLIDTSEHWRLGRMSVVDRNVLRLAVFELMTNATPPSVVINEALEVAKRFSSPESVSFVNGILDKVNRAMNPGKDGEATRRRKGVKAQRKTGKRRKARSVKA